jgi:hypothetical protein
MRTFHSDKEYIQAHLGCVLNILRTSPVLQLTPQQRISREHLISVLDGYRLAGNFPKNYYRRERLPVFIDENKTHCAVGYLLQQTGHEELALRISFADNYAWVKDIHDPELLVWQQESGFTLEELKLIQGSYDSYLENAFILPNKYEIPQKPAPMTVYFENAETGKPMSAKPENIWCKGEGPNGTLNGRWEQNYSLDMPWIVGYYENGKRSGQWMEYFQGTKRICRTENWRNNKLNGLRKRYDQEGNLIEEILFKEGKAILKKNYEFGDSLTWIRKPIDSNIVWTEVYTFGGSLIAAGHEKIYNPGNLQWFQNIQLTALNSASITARDAGTSYEAYSYSGGYRRHPFFYSPPLVTYKKEGDWVYYREYNYRAALGKSPERNPLLLNYQHFGVELQHGISMFENVNTGVYDSIRVDYLDNCVRNFCGYGTYDFIHLQIGYYDNQTTPAMKLQYGSGYEVPLVMKEYGQCNRANQKTGEWKHFTKDGRLYKTENYLVAWKEDD